MGLPFPFLFFPAYCEAGAWYSGNGAAEVRMCGATGLRAAARRPAGTRRRGRGRHVGNAAARSGRMRAGRRGREVRAAIADALRIACRENAGREVCGLPAAGAQAAILCLNARENSLSPRMAAARGPSAALWAYVAAGRQGAGVSGPERNPDCEKLLMKILKRVENHMKK